MTCQYEKMSKQLNEMQTLMEAQQERNKPVKDSRKEAIEIAIMEIKQACIEAVHNVGLSADDAAAVVEAIKSVGKEDAHYSGNGGW